MSVSLLLIIATIAVPALLFADKAMQWSLRLILDEGMDYSRAKAEVAKEAATEGTPAPQTAQQAA